MRADGTYDERIGPYEGRFVKDADDDLIEDLEARGRMFRSERLLHSYPHCWRCGTPLLYYAKPTWYIRTSAVKDRLLAANETVDWHPEHIKHGRFGPLAGEQRRLGARAASATGARRCRSGATRRARRSAVGSFEELKRALAASSSTTRTARSWTTSRSRRRPAASRCAACPR